MDGVTHAELAAAMGADILLLDRYDPPAPVIRGAPASISHSAAPLAGLKALIGCPLGINLLVGSCIPDEKAERAFSPAVAGAAEMETEAVVKEPLAAGIGAAIGIKEVGIKYPNRMYNT